MKGNPKYKTLAELKAAYDSGEIPRDEPLILDNDTSSVYDSWRYDNENADKAVRLFAMHPEIMLEEALDLLGIPHDHF